MTDREVMRMALDALEMEATNPPIPETGAAIEALHAALAEPAYTITVRLTREQHMLVTASVLRAYGPTAKAHELLALLGTFPGSA